MLKFRMPSNFYLKLSIYMLIIPTINMIHFIGQIAYYYSYSKSIYLKHNNNDLEEKK